MKRLFTIISLFGFMSAHAQLNYLFTSYSKPYAPVNGGISPVLSGPSYSNTPLQEWGSAIIPLGFTFNYNGKSYSELTANVNGFLALGNLMLDDPGINQIDNSLIDGPYSQYQSRPIIAPFWDDLGLHSVNDLVYKTSGTAPSRVFTVEWKNAYWNINFPPYPDLPPPGTLLQKLSFEVRLYETTNAIEFHYKKEGTEPIPSGFTQDYNLFPPYGHGASIGITPSYCNRDYLSLQTTSANPVISSLSSNDFIQETPADNQVYRFTPAPIKNPVISRNKIAYSDRELSFSLNAGNEPGYTFEYAVSRNPIPPASANVTGQKNIRVSGLQPATVYYIHARSRRSGLFSQWSSDSIRTASVSLGVPYTENFDGPYTAYGTLYGYALQPDNFRTQDFHDTLPGYSSHIFDPELIGPYIFPFGNNSIGSLTYEQYNFFEGADVWSFTPGINLTKGKKYKLHLSYMGYPINSPDIPAQLEVWYGSASGLAGMTDGRLFVKNDILVSDPELPVFNDTTLYFTAPRSGPFYFGYHNSTTFMGAELFIDDISVTEADVDNNRSLPITLTGNAVENKNSLSWKGAYNNCETIIESSEDGVHFNTIHVSPPVVSKFLLRKKQTQVSEHISGKAVLRPNRSTLGELEFSTDGVNYLPVSQNKEKHGFVSQQFIDNKTFSKFYRVKQINIKGEARYSNVICMKKDKESIAVYPNPSSSSFKLGGNEHNVYTVAVYDLKGNLLRNYLNITSGIEFGDDLPKGTYMLQLQCGSEKICKRIIKL